MSVVSVQTIDRLAGEVKFEGSLEKNMDFGIHCFEEGMYRILRLIAEQHITKSRENESTFTKDQKKLAVKKFEILESALSSKQNKDLLKDYADEIESFISCYGDDRFIDGFLSGFSYLFNEIKFGTGMELLKD